MSLLRKSAVIFVLLAVVIASNGISLQSHSCSMADRTTRILFPGIFNTKASCCCAATSSSPSAGTNVHRTPCCKNHFSYLKFPTYQDQRVSIAAPVKVVLPFPAFNIGNSACSTESVSVGENPYRPPPLKIYGKILLSYIHQLKFHLS